MGNASLSAVGGFSSEGHAEGLKDHLAQCDIILDNGASWETKRYETLVPLDVRLRSIIAGFWFSIWAFLPTILLWIPIIEAPTFDASLRVTLICIGLAQWVLFVMAQTPRFVVREADALVIESRLCRHEVPLGEVLELVVLRDGTHFRDLLARWKVVPHGPNWHFFLGAPSKHDALCVLLTKRCFWSFIFCLQNPVQFLLDNQRPLDLQATYRVAIKAVLREGESLESPQLGAIERGRTVRIEEQRGRRVKVRTDNDITGWISYISNKGWFILAKERVETEPQAGAIGASEFARSGEGAELGLLLPANRPGSLE